MSGRLPGLVEALSDGFLADLEPTVVGTAESSLLLGR